MSPDNTTSRRLNSQKGPKLNNVANTVFARNWAVTIFDEAHWLRTEGSALKGANALRIRSCVMILATATPLHNAERVSLICSFEVFFFVFTIYWE